MVKIEALCDPTPPGVWSDEKLEAIRADIELLLAQMSEMSEQELMDQVYRKMTLLLCARCYQQWIENPTG